LHYENQSYLFSYLTSKKREAWAIEKSERENKRAKSSSVKRKRVKKVACPLSKRS
jgi:hypothetical protein